MHCERSENLKNRVLMCQERFAPKVHDGTKSHTIRKSARCKPGALLSLRRWKGKPYRSKQEILREAICTAVIQITIGNGPNQDEICIGGILADPLTRDRLARADGFECATDLLHWFRDVHGLPFSGWLIEWSVV